MAKRTQSAKATIPVAVTVNDQPTTIAVPPLVLFEKADGTIDFLEGSMLWFALNARAKKGETFEIKNATIRYRDGREVHGTLITHDCGTKNAGWKFQTDPVPADATS